MGASSPSSIPAPATGCGVGKMEGPMMGAGPRESRRRRSTKEEAEEGSDRRGREGRTGKEDEWEHYQ